MEKFKISDIQELFVGDLDRFYQLTQTHVTRLLQAAVPPQESLDEALRQAHTLKGLTATVEAWGLSYWGADLEKLLELAGTWLTTDRARANEIFEFILANVEDWFVMNQFSGNDMLPQALEIYRGLRHKAEERWAGYLPPRDSEGDAQYVRLADLELKPVSEPKPVAANSNPRADIVNRDVQQPQPLAPLAKPTPVSVVPPNLRRHPSATKAAMLPPQFSGPRPPATPPKNSGLPISEPTSEGPRPTAPAAVPLQGAGTAKAARRADEVPVTPALKSMLPQLAPPPLKRRPRKSSATATSAAPVIQAETPVNAPTVVAKPAEIAAPGVDADLLELLANEIAGYLTELTKELGELARDLRDEARWDRVRRHFHTIKGTAATFNVESIAAPAKIAEAQAVLAIEDAAARTVEAFETCVTRAGLVAKELRLPFDEAALRSALPAAHAAEPTNGSRQNNPGADADLLEMLGTEITGYLTDLTKEFFALAGNLRDEARWDNLRRLFHTIKGTAATFNVDSIATPAKIAEARSLLATEDASTRTAEAYELCVERAGVVASELHLTFDQTALRNALNQASEPATPTAVPPEFNPSADADLLELLGQEIAGYLTELAGDLTVLAGNLQDATRWDNLRRLFHTIKGSAATFNVEAIATPAKAAEARCLVAVEDPGTRTVDALENCVQRGAIIAAELRLNFDAQTLRAALAKATTPPANRDVAGTFNPGADGDLLDLLAQEVGGYLTDLVRELTILAGDLKAETNWETARRLFHTIKGTAATFQLDAVSAPAKAAEARCIVAVEDAAARSAEAFETCVQRAQVIAQALKLPFDEAAVRVAFNQAGGLPAAVGASSTAPALDAEMAEFFIRDARDQIETIEQAVLRWERGVHAGEQLAAAQRGFHTLKGAANSIGLTPVAQSVHEAEAFLESLAAAGAKAAPAVFAFLFSAVDQIRNYLKALAANPATAWNHTWASALQKLSAAAPAVEVEIVADTKVVTLPSETKPAVDEDETQTLRIESNRLYELMNLIGEMVVDRARLGKKIEQLTGLYRALEERNTALNRSVSEFQQQFEFNLLQHQTGMLRKSDVLAADEKRAAGAAGEFSELEFDRYDQFNVLARSLVEVTHDIEQLNGEVSDCLQAFAAENIQFTQTSQQLQSKVTSLSLVPVHTLFPRLQRAFRDALQVEGKEADLVLHGGEAVLDKVLVDKIYAPLLHLLRNAVAHGVEDEGTRRRLQKSARGQVRFSAAQVANQIVVTLADDGSGVDAGAVRRRAIAKGWLPANAPELSAAQVAEFIFKPGFSTAARVTSVSGRGIGLDVVRKEIESLNGSVELKSEPGRGTVWTLRLPLTLSISEAIMTESGGMLIAFPMNFIESGVVLDAPTTRDEQGRELFRVGDQLLPVLRLARLLGLPGRAQANSGLIISVGDRRTIVVLDRVLKKQEIVIKQLDAFTALHPLLNGATLDGEGRVIPILNLPTLLKFGERSPMAAYHGGAGVEVARVAERRRVLIVDDSLSVRKVQERFLTDLGYEVSAATDGLVALERLREERFDFVFTDLEMPRMNGYELITELQSHPAWAGLPIAVISSRGADKYITKAMNLGAKTFLTKPFTQEQLGQVLRRYVGQGK